MRLALTATCITTLATLLAAEARADTTISTATTAPVRTSTAGNISITADGSITPTAAGNAVTIDSNNTVTSAGKITFSGINDAAGIVAAGGFTSGITNSGAITLDETYTRTDTNADTVLDGPYAQGSNRYAIRIDGTTPFTGTLNNTGVITVRGNNSAGIYAAAPIVGNVTTNTGAITVTGNNDYGVRLGAVTGNVAISSAISMLGGNSTGLALTGNVTGQVVVHGSITTTGYSSTALPTDVTKLTAENLQRQRQRRRPDCRRSGRHDQHHCRCRQGWHSRRDAKHRYLRHLWQRTFTAHRVGRRTGHARRFLRRHQRPDHQRQDRRRRRLFRH
jgi:hypothetical protein